MIQVLCPRMGSYVAGRVRAGHRAWLPLSRSKSTLTIVKPSASASRYAPTPIVFLAVKPFADASSNNPAPNPRDAQSLWSSWISQATTHGYESMLLDVDPEELQTSAPPAPTKVLDLLEREMVTQLRSASAFPPILFARGYDSVAAEQYASSHGLSALFLLDPATSFAEARGSGGPKVLRGDEEGKGFEFDFEPRFACRVAWSQARLQADGEEARLHRIEEELFEEEEQEGRIVWEDADKQGPEEMRTWLEDECGLGPPVEEHGDDRETRTTSGAEDGHEDADGSSIWVHPSGSGYPTWFIEGSYHFHPTGTHKSHPLVLDETHLRESFRRGGGKGGQAINKNRSRCDLLHIPTGTIVRCQETRSLERNRVIARRRMSLMLDEGLRGQESVRGREAEDVRRRKRNRDKKQKQKQKTRWKEEEEEEENMKESENEEVELARRH